MKCFARSPLSLAIAATFATGLAQAQQQATAPRTAELEAVTVTAQKRKQLSQEVPISVDVVNAEALEKAGITSIYNLQTAVPALQVQAVDPPGQGTSFALRGLGNSVFNMGFEPAVAAFVDGVYRSRSGLLAATDFLDIERIEVLKGPQGTLFGKNTTAGVVQMTSKKPTIRGGAEGDVTFAYEQYNTMKLKAASNLPVNDMLAFRLAATTAKSDGYMKIQSTGEEINGFDRQAVKAQMLLKPNADLSVHLIADYAKSDDNCCAPMRLSNDPGSVAANAPTTIVSPPDLKALRVDLNQAPTYKATDAGLSAEVNWNVGGMTLTSVTGMRKYEDKSTKDNDFTAVDMLRVQSDLPKVDLLSQELRLSGDTGLGGGKSLKWQTGVYASKEKIERHEDWTWGADVGRFGLPIIAPGTLFISDFVQEVKSAGIFAHTDWTLSEQWSVIAGLRWSKDSKTGSLRSQFPPNAFGLANTGALGNTFDYDASTSDSEPTYTLSGQFRPAKDTMLYTTYAHGYKSGGISMSRDAAGLSRFFNPGAFVGAGCPPGSTTAPLPPGFPPILCDTTVSSNPTFKPETVNHLEVGSKQTLMNNRMRLNLSGWYTHFKDLQLQTLRGDGSFAVTNAAGASSKGIEGNVTYKLSADTTLNTTLQYLDAKFDSGVPALSTGSVNGVPFPAMGGQQIPYASHWTGSVGISHDMALGNNLQLGLSGNLYAKSKYNNFTEPHPELVQGGYTLLGLRASLSTDKWELALYCRNCTDERYTYSNFAIPFDGAQLPTTTRFTHIGEPRFVGASLSYRFD